MRARPGGDRVFVWGVFALAFALRVAHVISVRDAPVFRELFIDPRLYDSWARAIVSGQWISPAPFFLDPLYPYFVAAIYAVAGPNRIAVALVQALAGALVAPLLVLAARRWLDATTARVSGVLAAIYLPSIYYAAPLLKPGLAHVAIAVWVFCMARALDERRGPDWLFSGLAFGIAWLLRGNLLWVAPVLAIVLPFVGRGGRLGEGSDPRWGPRARESAWFLAGFALVAIAPTAHNLAASGEWIVGTANVGQIFFIGNNPANPSGRFKELPFVRSDPAYEQPDFKTEAERRAGHPLTHREVSRFWMREGLRWALAHPVDWARLQWSKLRFFWGAYETPASLDYYLYRRQAPVLRLPLPGFGTLGPLALLGLVPAFRRRGWPRMLAIYVLLATLAVTFFFVLTRFRMIALPPVCVLAALGLVELVRRVRAIPGGGRPAGVRLAAVVALLACAFAFVDLPVRATGDTWWFRLARAVGLPTRLETTANAYYNLGVTHAAEAKTAERPAPLLERAEAELRQAVAERPDDPLYRIELGKVLARQQRNAEAIEVYREAAALAPGDFRVYHAIGILERRTGSLDAAADAFRTALRLEPRFAPSAVELGQVLLDAGRPSEAARAFGYALRLRPGEAEAERGLRRAEREAAGE